MHHHRRDPSRSFSQSSPSTSSVEYMTTPDEGSKPMEKLRMSPNSSPPHMSRTFSMDDRSAGERNGKRLRISRACQHCKSRKTRCDAIGAFPHQESADGQTDSTGPRMVIVQPCTNCVRGGIPCFYTKRQLKRGPSKGYIKELEKRLDSLESSLHAQTGSPSREESVMPEKPMERPGKRLMRLESVVAMEAAQHAQIEKPASKPCSPQLSPPPSPLAEEEQSRPKARGAEAVAAVKASFFSSHLNESLPVVHPANHTSLTEMGLSEGMLVRAIKLLLEPVEDDSASTPPSPPSASSINTVRTLPHSQRLQLVIGRAMMGDEDLQARHLSGSPCFSSLAGSNGTKETIHHAQAGLEADSLILCYLDALRRGQANGAVLAAAMSKLTMAGFSSQAGLARQVVALIVDRWHAVGFNAPFHLTMTLSQTYADLLRNLPGSNSDVHSVTSEILRGAMAFQLFREALQGEGNKVSHDDMEAILCRMKLDDGSKSTDTMDAHSTQAMRPSICNTLRAYHALFQLPRILGEAAATDDVTAQLVDAHLRLIDGVLTVGRTGAVVDAGFPVVRSYVTVLLAWLSRTIAFLARQALLDMPKPHADLETLELLRRRVYDWLSLIWRISLHANEPKDKCSFTLLYSRIAAFAHANVGYVAQLGDLGSQGEKVEGLQEDNPIRDDDQILGKEADGFREAFLRLGPLGVALSATDNRDAWALHADTTTDAK